MQVLAADADEYLGARVDAEEYASVDTGAAEGSGVGAKIVRVRVQARL